jgi:phosphoserine phosphatase
MIPPRGADALLIQITGRDTAGLTHSLTTVLADHGVRVLDIGQAVIHDSLSLGLLIEMTPAARSSPLLPELLLKAHELNLQVRFTAIPQEEYARWVAAQRKLRFVVTLLGREIEAVHLAEVSRVLAAQGLNIDRIDRLSRRLPLHEVSSASRSCVEFSVSAESADEDALRAGFMSIAQEMGVDIAFQHDNLYRRARRLVAFDMDSTLIEAEVIDELAAEAGVGAQVAAITEAAMRGELDFQESFRRRVALLTGLPETALDRVAGRIPLMEGAGRLIATLKHLGYKTAILSGGFTWFGRQLQQRLGIDYLHANELVIRNGKVTGEVALPIVDGARKAELLKQIAAQEGLSLEQVIAVGDGANDLPMLGVAGLGIAFRAKPRVRTAARQSVSSLGLDGILYLLGVRDRDVPVSSPG